MKNSKNKILAAVACGVIAGSIGTSIVGNFQSSSKTSTSTTASNSNKKNSNVIIEDSEVASNDDSLTSSNDSSNTYDSNERPSKGQGGRGGHHQGEASLDSVETVDVANGQYIDGTYEGSASGFASNLKVQVQIANGQIADIQVVSHNETPGFCERAIESVPAEIVSSQSTNVDTVSGATYTSVGIINAVNDALSSAQS